MTPAESRRLAALESEIAVLKRAVGNARGLGVNTTGGAIHYRTTQLGFAAELTTDYDETTGYGWKRKRLVPGLAEPFTNPGVQLRGDRAFSFVGERSLVPGTDGWMEPSPDASGFIFIHRFSLSGSGADDGGGGGCDLETVSFDVVTAVSCDASGGLTVTTRRVSITGCNLSVSQGDPPAAGSGSGSGGMAFATDCQGTGESLEAHPDVSLSITDGPYSGVYALVWSATNPGAGPDGGAGWLLETTISAVPYRFFLFSAGPPGDIRWYLWVTNLNTSGTIVVIAASGACDQFSLAFPGADLGSADDVTVVIPP